MTPLQWFGLALLVALACGGAYLVGWSVSRQSAENLILAAERDGLVKGTAKGQLEGYNGGFTAGWRAAHRLALTELGAYPTSRGGKRIVKALAAMVPPDPKLATLYHSVSGAYATEPSDDIVPLDVGSVRALGFPATPNAEGGP